MNRRFFLKNTMSISVLSSLAITSVLRYYMDEQSAHSIIDRSAQDERILVLIQLDGGNDGLNTVIPLDQYGKLAAVRKNILIPEKYVLPLTGISVTGFHPSMAHLQRMYNNKGLTVIQGVGYPGPSYSHFRSADIWLTGSDSDKVLNTGWIGRLLDREYPAYPNGYPNSDAPDPPAIQVGSYLSTALQGPSAGMGMAITDTSSFYDLVLGAYAPAVDSPAGRELGYMRVTASETQRYTSVIRAAAGVQKNLSSLYPSPGTNLLADQLKIVAQLIGGGLKTKVYMVNLDGFDTHGGQVDHSDPSHGRHSDLLAQLSMAIEAFQDDLQLMKKDDKVLGMVFSEFGRRIRSNASNGTDHGTTGPVFLFGPHVKGGMVGSNPLIPDKVTVDDNLPLQIDFRSVYVSVLKGWFGVYDAELASSVPGKYPVLDIFKS